MGIASILHCIWQVFTHVVVILSYPPTYVDVVVESKMVSVEMTVAFTGQPPIDVERTDGARVVCRIEPIPSHQLTAIDRHHTAAHNALQIQNGFIRYQNTSEA